MNIAATLAEVEAAGAVFRLDGERVRIWYSDEERRRELAEHIASLRAHRAEVAAFLRTRNAVLEMPLGVRLIQWNLKEPPVSIDTCSVVTDPARFARTTLEQLRIALAEPKRWLGWTVPQLVDRLAQVGVVVALESSDAVP